MTYTYDDIKKRLASGNYALSDADMKLAERNPDAVMSILNYKDDYANATTDEARALANMGAENVRRTQGGYTGGVDGSNFYLESPAPSSFDAGSAPSFSSGYSSDVKSSYDALKNYKPFEYDAEAPSFIDKYAGTRENLVNQISNPEKFSYDTNNDESYKAYAKQYRREGSRATADALADASAQSGGIASSYALTAANQAGNYYAAQLADKIPELYERAYNRYLNEYAMKREALNSVQAETAADYDRYLGDYNVYNTNRNFAYQKYLDDYERARNQLSDASALENQDYSRYRDSVSDYENDRNFRYQQLLDTISNNQYEDEKNYTRAQDRANYRDYSGLEDYGYNMDAQRAQDALSDEYSRVQLGSGYADLGDYDNLDRLGIDSATLRENRKKALEQALLENQLTQKQIANYDQAWADDSYSRQLELAQLAAKSGDYSKLRALGIDTTAAEKGTATDSGTSDAAKLYKAIADYKAGKATEEQYDILINAGILNADGSGAPPDTSGIDPNSPAGRALRGVRTIEGKKTADSGTATGGYRSGFEDVSSMLPDPDRTLSRAEWKVFKARGVDLPGVADSDTYEEYLKYLDDLAEYQKYLAQEG